MDPFTWTGASVEDVYGAPVGRVRSVLVRDGEVWLELSLRRGNGTRVVQAVDAIGDSRRVWLPVPREEIEQASAALQLA